MHRSPNGKRSPFAVHRTGLLPTTFLPRILKAIARPNEVYKAGDNYLNYKFRDAFS